MTGAVNVNDYFLSIPLPDRIGTELLFNLRTVVRTLFATEITQAKV